jgi:phosphoglycolate phosphatase-like HAD superfamily hydrolase
MRLRGIIFDFDGTLADTWGVYDSAFARVMRSFLGREIPFEERIKNKGADEIDFVRNLVPASPDEAARLFVSAFEEAHYRCVELYPEMRPLLDDLSMAGARLGIVSAKAHESGRIAFEMIPVRHYFDPIVTGTGWSGGKAPNISNVVSAWGLHPAEVAYVGDSRNDMVDARNAGVHAIGAAWDGMPFAVSTPGELHDAGATAVFTAPQQLAHWVKSRLG